MNIKEILAGIVWTASSVAIAGFTYEAFAKTHDTGGSTAGPLPVAPPAGFEPPGTVFGPHAASPKQAGKRSIAPPRSLITPLTTAVQAHNKRSALAAWYNIVKWGNSQGVASIQLENWLAGQPFYPKLFSMLPQGVLTQ